MDKYTQFTFNGVHSSAYNLFYVNEDGGMRYPFSPSFSQQTIRPMYQGRSYYLGTDIQESTYDFTFAADRLTNAERRAIFDWLDIGKPAYIKFDAFPNYKQKVLITNISNGAIYPREWQNGLIENIVEFSITFQTVGNPYPETDTKVLSSIDAEDTEIKDPETRLPMAKVKTMGTSFDLFNWTSLPQYYSLLINTKEQAIVEHETETIYSITETTALDVTFSVNIEGETGISKIGETIAEASNYTVVSNGPLILPSNLLFNGKVKTNLSVPTANAKLPSGLLTMLKYPFVVAILPPQTAGNSTVISQDSSIGVYPAEPMGPALTIHEPLYLTITDEDELAFLKAAITGRPWISDEEQFYHMIITQPYNIKITGTNTETSLQMSYRNRL